MEGPTLYLPPTPKSFLRCDDCKYLSVFMTHSGGLKGKRIYSVTCSNPEIFRRTIDSSKHGRSNIKTPIWCPYRKKSIKEYVKWDLA